MARLGNNGRWRSGRATEREPRFASRSRATQQFAERPQPSRCEALWFGAVVNMSMDAVLIIDESGHIVLFNPAAEQIFRCPEAEALGQPASRFIPETLGERLATSEPCARGSATRDHIVRTVLTRHDGEKFCAEVAVKPLDPAAPAGRVVTLRDVSDRRHGEHTVRKLSRALASIADAVFVTDKNGFIEYVNPSFAQMMGVVAEDVIGQRPSLFKSNEHDTAFYEQLWATLRSGEVYRGVLIERTGDGRLIHLEQTITPLRDEDGHITHFISTGRDITSRVQTEAALRCLNEALERQTRDISQALHDEAGQLLTSAYIALANAKRELPTSSHDHLQVLKSHLDGIEEQLRHLAYELRPRILDDMGLVPALRFLADGLARRSGITVRVESTLTTRLPALVETTIYRVGQEALSNVRRHASADRVTLHLDRQPRQLRCTVSDNGVGYDPGRALNASGGQGTGLQSMRDRVEALGGTMHIQSATGKGTELVVAIPLED
jgi:two-component system, NarL family, sensor histidine kinase NreB